MSLRSFCAWGSCALSLLASASAASAGDVDGIITDSGKWSGAYVGLNAGFGWSDMRSNNDFGSGIANFFAFDIFGVQQHQANHIDGYVVGGQVGFQRQFGHWVLGVEGTLDGTGIDGKTSDPMTPFVPFLIGTQSLQTRVENLFQVSGKVGYTFGDWMAYARGGWAGANVSAESNISGVALGFVPFSSSSEDRRWHNGWSVGGGLERMIFPNLTVGVEYNFIDLGSRDYAFDGKFNVGGGSFTAPYHSRIDVDNIQTVTFRLNFLLNSPEQMAAAPLK
jgi:outer membrane immunogenic protein